MLLKVGLWFLAGCRRATRPRSTPVNYQSKSMSPSPLCSETGGRELKHRKLQYKINIFLSDCLLVALGHHGTRLPPDCLPIASRLPPDCFKIAPRLPPDCFQIASSLLPDCCRGTPKVTKGVLRRNQVVPQNQGLPLKCLLAITCTSWLRLN